MTTVHKRFAPVLALATTAFFGSISGEGPYASAATPPAYDPVHGLILRGTIVTMDDRHTVIPNGSVLVRNDRIVALWQGPRAPAGTPIGDAVSIDLGPKALIFPGMINLHNHPTYNTVALWPAPTSHVQPDQGRPNGTEPYANRYQWNRMFGREPPEGARLIAAPQTALTSDQALNLSAEVVKYAEVKSLVGGETSLQGAPSQEATDNLLARNVDSTNFGRARIFSSVEPIATATATDMANLLGAIQFGAVDAWLVHLAEGVKDGDRRPGDPVSSRAEFAVLKADGLLSDSTVLVHGVALEREDFAAMRAAPSLRADHSGDGLGAKLVWSPLSNLLLYGRTTSVYDALAENVLVSLGTDWSPSGLRNLLGELKIADIALRDPAILGSSRSLIPSLSVDGRTDDAAEEAERSLDQVLVDMVTRNPAKTVRWYDELGSIETGKTADLFVITEPQGPGSAGARRGMPHSPYRSLIDATESDVHLVLVGGEPLVGDAVLMQQLKPGDNETIPASCECNQKAIDVTKPGVPKGDQTLATILGLLNDSLVALGGDHPPAGGGPADDSNTYSYLLTHVPLPFPMTDAQFRQFVLTPAAGTVGGKLNLERLTLPPIFVSDDDFFFDVLANRLSSVTGLLDDSTPPFKLYPSNANHVVGGKNPFASDLFEERWYPLSRQGASRDLGQVNACFSASALVCER